MSDSGNEKGLRRAGERLAPVVLGAAMVAYVSLGMWLTRGIAFINDETRMVAISRGLDPETILTPHNGHLIATARALYAGSLSAFGTSHVFIRMVELGGVALCAALLFVFLRRRVDALVALAPTLVVLCLGSSSVIVLSPVGIPAVYATAAGLEALLALDRGDRRGDILAAGLLIAAVLTFSGGLPFLAGAAAWILLGNDRRGRIWVFAVPLVLYAAWFIWALRFDQGETRFSNLLEVPSLIADAFAGVLRGVTGLSYFGETGWVLGAGQVLAVAALLVLAFAVARRRPRVTLWALLVIPLTLWALIALNANVFRPPDSSRYFFPGAVGVMLIGAEVLRGTRFSTRALLALYAVAILALASNLLQLRDAGATFRNSSAKTRAALGVYGLAADAVDPEYRIGIAVPVAAGEYLEGARHNGFYGFTPAELQEQPETVRAFTDRTLVAALGISAEPIPEPPAEGCSPAPRSATGAVDIEVPPGGAVLRSRDPAQILLARFASAPVVAAGNVPGGGGWVTLAIPGDASTVPWRAALDSPDRLVVCPLSDAIPSA